MFRTFAIAAVALALTGTAVAQTAWTSSDNAFSITLPKGWAKPDRMSSSNANVIEYAAGNANEECVMYQFARAETATAAPDRMKAAWATALDTAKWSTIVSPLAWSGGAPAISDAKVETANGWPVQTAIIAGKNGPAVAAIHSRPGIEVWVFCQSYDGKDRIAQFRQTAVSVTTPRDAEFAAAEAAAAEAKAKADADAAAAAAAAAEAQKGKKKRN